MSLRKLLGELAEQSVDEQAEAVIGRLHPRALIRAGLDALERSDDLTDIGTCVNTSALHFGTYCGCPVALKWCSGSICAGCCADHSCEDSEEI